MRTASPAATRGRRARRGPVERGGGEPQQRAVVLGDHPVGGLLAGETDGVDHPAGRFVGDPPPRAPEPPAEVDVLDVHEVALVEPTDGLERGAPQEHARPRHPVDVAGHGVIPVEHAVAPGEPVGGVDQAEERVTHGIGQGRERAGGGVQRAVDVLDARADERERGVSIERVGEHLDRSRLDERVGVEEQDVLAAARRHAAVGGRPEPEVRSGREDDDVGVARGHRAVRSVGRRVVGHHDVDHAVGPQAANALDQIVTGVVVDDDCADAHGSGQSPFQKRYRTRVASAANPSVQVIFLPSSRSRPE